MDFKDQIKQLADRVARLKDSIQTEEATKNAFVMPFLQCLGYDVFDPHEVVPEFISDIGTKKGEKVDYAIMRDGQPCMLMECKHHAQSLTLHDNQLLRYFHVTKARFGVLTNGVIYRFYTDLVEPNKMDEKPFLEVNLVELKENLVEELKKFHKSYFDVNTILSTASELKYTSELKGLIQQEMANPSDTVVRHLAKQVYGGQLNAKMMDYFTSLVRKSFHQVMTDQITERLKTALIQEQNQQESINLPDTLAEEKKVPVVTTTPEELEAFYIVRAVLRTLVDPARIVHRDAQSYFAILLDDNNRKAICRLYFNSSRKFIAFIDEQKKENRHEIQSLNDIFLYSEELISAIRLHDKALASGTE